MLMGLIIRRGLSSAQVSTALRPFYFLVHPDLFGKWPQEQAVNETSLKQLKSYLNIMIDEKRKPTQPLNATFYIKPRFERKRPRKINLKLNRENGAKVRKAVTAILSTVELPTSFVDSIPDTELDLESKQSIFPDFYYEEEQIHNSKSRLDMLHHTDIRRPLPRWLKDNVEAAQAKMAKSEPIRLQTERLQDELCHKLNLSEILWDCGWDISHKRGVVASFENLIKEHQDLMPILDGRTIVFGDDSGLSLGGQIILYTGEVRSNWLKVIRNVPQFEVNLKNIPLVEKALSQSLLNIKIVHRKNQPLKLVDNYKAQLIKLVTNVNDYLSKQKLPKHWPESLQDFEMCVDNESSPLTLSSTGQFIVPASCPGFLLIPFINENLKAAEKLLDNVEEHRLEELNLIIKCINELGLIQLDRDESLDSKTMIECCTRLLKNAPKFRHLTHGNHIVVTRYYSVNHDGVICIPWNWKIEFLV